MGDLRCAWDGQHDGRAAEEPGEGDLEGRGLEFFSEFLDEVVRGGADLTQRRPGDEGDSVFLAVIEEEVPFAVGEAVAILN